MTRGLRDAHHPAPGVQFDIDVIGAPLVNDAVSKLAEVECAIATAHVVHIDGTLPVEQLDALAGKTSVARATGNISKDMRVGAMSALQPQGTRAGGPRQFMVIEVERAK